MKQVIYEINQPMVIAEVFDDETIIIHFDTGNYYSLDSFSSIVWRAMEERVDVSSLPDILSTCFKQVSSGELRKLVNQLVAELLSEDLIRSVEGVKPGEVVLAQVDCKGDLPENAGCLTKFDDMQELLLLDPIHDVDAAGWPHIRKPESNG